MEENIKTKALVLKRQDYRENDSLVIFYTEKYGKLKLIARGTKKEGSKIAGHIEPLTQVDLMIIKGKGFDYVGSALTTQAFLNIKDNLNSLHFAFLGSFWLLKLIEEDESDKVLFDILVSYLSLINEHSEDISREEGELFFSFFVFKMLSHIGYKPQTELCLSCKNVITPGVNYFNLKNGGIVCQDCFYKKKDDSIEYLKISTNTIKIVRFIIENNLKLGKKIRLDKKTNKELLMLSTSFLQYRL